MECTELKIHEPAVLCSEPFQDLVREVADQGREVANERPSERSWRPTIALQVQEQQQRSGNQHGYQNVTRVSERVHENSSTMESSIRAQKAQIELAVGTSRASVVLNLLHGE